MSCLLGSGTHLSALTTKSAHTLLPPLGSHVDKAVVREMTVMQCNEKGAKCKRTVSYLDCRFCKSIAELLEWYLGFMVHREVDIAADDDELRC